ncbi:hypothetical protein [Serratia sp. BIGb0163]|uniref:hypothetical protein n=1 Tax=Serratia sp. BIGb0163 TaxID=2940613 RepID=UPI002167270E|nr:hypothetical protein [Serratia sp. BIGb0163]MCS4266604.1 starvation-inducible outer membrane lipoprotein [Serratia sp. BIGb0163]
MRNLKLTALTLLSSLLISGCVSPGLGVQVTSSVPMSVTRMTFHGNTVILCQVGE